MIRVEQNNDLNNYDDGENGYAPNGSMNTGYANYTDDVSEENISSDIHSTDNDNVFIQTDDTSAFNPNKPMQINNGNNLFDFDNNKNLNSSFSDSSNANNMYSGNNSISQDGLPGDFSGNINSGDINGGNDKENKRIKKERKGAKKIFASIGCGIIFGIFACFSFYAVNEVACVLGIGGGGLLGKI